MREVTREMKVTGKQRRFRRMQEKLTPVQRACLLYPELAESLEQLRRGELGPEITPSPADLNEARRTIQQPFPD